MCAFACWRCTSTSVGENVGSQAVRKSLWCSVQTDGNFCRAAGKQRQQAIGLTVKPHSIKRLQILKNAGPELSCDASLLLKESQISYGRITVI